MWMAPKDEVPFDVKIKANGKEYTYPSSTPSIEGIFYRNGNWAYGSYNYGNSYLSHAAFDIIPYLFMD